MKKKLRIAIIDDDKMIHSFFDNFLADFFNTDFLWDCFYTAEEFLSAVNEEDFYHILFVDIELPGIKGVDFARRFKKDNPTSIIIFLTSYSQYAITGYEIGALRYLVKPVDVNKLNEALTKAMEVLETNKSYFRFNYNRSVVILPLDQILFFESCGRELMVITLKNKYTLNKTMKSLEQELNDKKFVRAHKSFLINVAYIRNIKDNTIVLEGEYNIPVGYHFKKNLLNCHNSFLRSKF